MTAHADHPNDADMGSPALLLCGGMPVEAQGTRELPFGIKVRLHEQGSTKALPWKIVPWKLSNELSLVSSGELVNLG